jgi:hypothetical protein
MSLHLIAEVDSYDVLFFSFIILSVFLGLFIVFMVSIWLSKHQDCPSPYTGSPLRHGENLSYETKKIILKYLYHLNQYENQMFELRKAAICRETGRIFPNGITWFNRISVDWTFLNKRYPGDFISWGSLSREQQLSVRMAHDTLEGFQTEYSSSNPSPRKIEEEFALASPGPLYVDINTKVVMGWKRVPETELELLIVQKPKKMLTITTISDPSLSNK